jgi:hypothetical protein
MMFKEGNYYELPVKDVITENRKAYYVVTADGKEYAIPIFDFQKVDAKPDSIVCYVKEVTHQTPVFIQDTRPLLRRLYQKDKVYPFWVRANYTHTPNPYYEITDWNNFNFKLYVSKTVRLAIRQRVECRVKEIDENLIHFELVKEQSRTLGLPFFQPEELAERIGWGAFSGQCVRKAFLQNRPLLREARESYHAGAEVWIMQAIEALDTRIIEWVTARHRIYRRLLEAYQRLCFYLLEDSDILTNCTDQERRRYQDLLSRAVQHSEVFGEALTLVERNEHERQVDVILNKMQKSGFLFEPGKRLQVMMYIFMLDEQVMERKMQVVFDTILVGNKDNWQTEPFRSAFIEMLDLYVEHNRYKVDRMASTDNAEHRSELKKLLTALAILLLLVTDKDDYDRQLRRAMFYRYLTFLKGGKQDVLLEKAFRCITEAEQTKLEYNWKDVGDLTMLAIRTSSEVRLNAMDRSMMMQTYNGLYSRLQIMDGKLELHPLLTPKKRYPALPEQLLPWHHIQVFLGGEIMHLAKDENNLTVFQRFWKDVEHNAFTALEEEKMPQRRKRKLQPEVGDEVLIRVKRQDADDSDYFLVEIEDPTYEGSGRLTIRNIVRYRVMVDESAFRDEMNRPFLLKAKVLSVDPETGEMQFTMLDQVSAFMRYMVSVGEEVICMVTDVVPGHMSCVSDLGYTVLIPLTTDTDELQKGKYVRVRITEIRYNATVMGEYIDLSDDSFSLRDAFENLILNYAEDQVYETKEEEKETDILQPEVLMDDTYLKELIYIIDRKAVTDDNYVNTYNYLAFARLLTMLVKDKDHAQYYAECMALIQLLQHFAINGSVDQEKLLELSSSTGLSIQNYPVLQSKLTELQLVACMDHPEKNEMAWRLAQDATDEHLQNLGRMVLSYNMLRGFGLAQERAAVQRRITEELHIEMDTVEPKFFGREDLHREFKTSIIYPAGNSMRCDLKAQRFVILKVIAGFLNAEGGKLLLGVNNEGVASGLESDIQYFGSLDKFDLYLRNQIVYEWGPEVNARIRTSLPDGGGKLVYQLDIQPSPKPVKLEDVVYQRQGTSTWALLGDDLAAFTDRREREVLELLTAMQAAAPVPTATAETEAPAVELPIEPMATEETKPEISQTEEALNVSKESHVILTSVIRENPVQDWEENYGVDAVCYLHFLPGSEYMVTREGIYDETDLSLCIREDDEYIVLVYEDGSALKVAASAIADKKDRVKYKRKNAKVVFACPARSTDLLLTATLGDNGHKHYRLDKLSRVREKKITEGGELLTSMTNAGVVLCDILPADCADRMPKIFDLKPTQQGNFLDNDWCKMERENLQKVLGAENVIL